MTTVWRSKPGANGTPAFGTACHASARTRRSKLARDGTGRQPTSVGFRVHTEVLALGGRPGLQDGGRGVPSTSRRATTRALGAEPGEFGRRLRRGPPTGPRAVGLRQVDGTALSRQGAGQHDGNGDGNPLRRARSRLIGLVRLTSATTISTAAALHLESESALAGPADLQDGRGAAGPPASPKGYHTPYQGQS